MCVIGRRMLRVEDRRLLTGRGCFVAGIRLDRPLAGSLLDYLLPTVAETPGLLLEELETPNPNSPLGARGAGGAGCIGTPTAVANAVADALDLPDPSDLQMPLMPGVVWAAAQHGGLERFDPGGNV